MLSMGRFNAIALPPQSYYQGPLTRGPSNCQPPCHVEPHTGVRVDPGGLLPCVHATCTSRGPCAALPRGLSATSHPRWSRTPRQLCAPRQRPCHVIRRVCGIKKPLFRDFNKKKNINSIKIHFKSDKNQKKI